MHEKRTIAADAPVAWCVCQSACKSVCMSRACAQQKAPERIEATLGRRFPRIEGTLY